MSKLRSVGVSNSVFCLNRGLLSHSLFASPLQLLHQPTDCLETSIYRLFRCLHPVSGAEDGGSEAVPEEVTCRFAAHEHANEDGEGGEGEEGCKTAVIDAHLLMILAGNNVVGLDIWEYCAGEHALF